MVFYSSPNKRASASSLQQKGSITVEAAAVVSFFFLAMVSLTYLFEIMSVQTAVRNGLHAVAREVAEELITNPMVSSAQIEKKLVEKIGTSKLNESMIVGGSEGIDCSGTKKRWNTDIVELKAVYRVEIPIFLFHLPIIRREEELRVKGWTGDEGGWGELLNEDYVYMTEHGVVYHKKKDCTYLDLSIHSTRKEDVSQMRNQSGAIYKACSFCGGVSKNDWVYVTDYGRRYHGSLSCSRLKRKTYQIPLRDVYGMGGCKKCVE